MPARLTVKVSTRASSNRLQSWQGEQLKICVTAVPEKGKANAAVIKLLADKLDVPRTQIQILSGGLHSRKTLCIDNLDDAECRRRIAKVLKYARVTGVSSLSG